MSRWIARITFGKLLLCLTWLHTTLSTLSWEEFNRFDEKIAKFENYHSGVDLSNKGLNLASMPNLKHHRLLTERRFDEFSNQITIKMAPFDLCLLMMDLRHLSPYLGLFSYGNGWVVTLTFNSNGTAYKLDFGENIPPPSGFVNKTNSPYMFSFMALEEGTLNLELNILNPKFELQILSTLNITTYEVVKPNRVTLGKTDTFMATIKQEDGFVVPDNIMMFSKGDEFDRPPFVFSEANRFAESPNLGMMSTNPTVSTTEDQAKDSATRRLLQAEGATYDQLATREDVINSFFNDGADYKGMPYLPYFSKCEYFGNAIYLFMVFETHPLCKLYSEQEVVPIRHLLFGQSATADICEGITFNCQYTQDVENETDGQWFKAENGATLFWFYQKPINGEEAIKFMQGQKEISDEDLVPVGMEASLDNAAAAEGNMIPTEIELDVNYYQKSKQDKELMTAKVAFRAFIDPSKYENQTFNYTLTVNYKPLNHTEVLIAFGLPWFVYLLMYIFVGILTIIMTAVFMLYHKLVSRFDVKFYFFPYFKYYLPPTIYGLLYVVIPQFIYMLLISIIFSHRILELVKLQKWFCTNSQDSQCLNSSLWDLFYLTKGEDQQRGHFQNARIGYLLTHTGLWLHWRTAQLCDIDKTKGEKEGRAEAFDNNVWYKTNWKRINYVAMSMLLILFQIFHVHFSFTDLFSANIWPCIFIFKLIGITTENVCEVFIGDKLMMAPISSTIPLMENLATFGASDFSEFVLSYVMGFGIMMCERVYLIPSLDLIVEYILEKIEKLNNFLQKTFGKQEEDDEDDDDENVKLNDDGGNSDGKGDGEANEINSKADSRGSDILITENSFENEIFEKFKNFAQPILYYKNSDGEIEISDSEHSDRLKKDDDDDQSISQKPERTDEEKIALVTRKINKRKDAPDLFELAIKQKLNSQNNLNDKVKKEEANDGNDLFNVDSDNNIESYYNYTVEVVSFFYMPFINLVIWQFYDETSVSKQWGIRRKDFFFYFLFSSIVIPFQVIIDILFFNIMSYYLGFDYLNSLRKWNKEFKDRENYWRGFDPEKTHLDYKLRRLEKLSYSSQYYFIAYLGSSGHLILIVGIMSIIEAQSNPWDDSLILVILAFNQLIIWFVEWLTLKARKWLRIWELKEEKDAKKTFQHAESQDFTKFMQIKNFDENLELKNLNTVESLREKDLQFKILIKKLMQSDFITDNYKQNFISINNQWLCDNISNILTPRTVYQHRKSLLDTLTGIRGPIQLLNERKLMLKQERGILLDMKEKENLKKSLKPGFLKIFQVWILRARKIKLIRSQVAGVMERMTQPFCQFCGRNWGLRCETIDSIEELFDKFLKEVKGQNPEKWDLIRWQSYFTKNAYFRTICYSCYEEISPYKH